MWVTVYNAQAHLCTVPLWYCRQLLHGDLRSPNLFVGSDGKVKIGEFSYCMELPQGKKVVKVDKVTHPSWTAPEVRL